MYAKHTTRDGRTLLIGEMSDEHLINTIRLQCREIEAQVSIATGEYVQTKSDVMIRIILDIDREDLAEMARTAIRRFYQMQLPYIAEAALRGIDISEYLQSAYGRQGAMTEGHTLTALPAIDVEDLL